MRWKITGIILSHAELSEVTPASLSETLWSWISSLGEIVAVSSAWNYGIQEITYPRPRLPGHHFYVLYSSLNDLMSPVQNTLICASAPEGMNANKKRNSATSRLQ
uniref:Uncharacterized protein n=1 Tax=Steinernema glaseri TaxID=37863 RepID=A0A1I7YG74_9BILA